MYAVHKSLTYCRFCVVIMLVMSNQHSYMYTMCEHTDVRVLSSCIGIYTHIYKCVHIHVYVGVYIYIYVHAHTCIHM